MHQIVRWRSYTHDDVDNNRNWQQLHTVKQENLAVAGENALQPIQFLL